MKAIAWLVALCRADVPARELHPYERAGVNAYDLVDQLPRGSARLAAWNAYVLQTYADKLVAASETSRYVRADTAQVAEGLYRLVGWWIERSSQLTVDLETPVKPLLADSLPHWHTPIRSQEQLVGMRESLEALRAYVAYDLQGFQADEAALSRLRGKLAAIDARIDTVDSLWIPRAPDELRGGIGDAVADGLDQTYVLGQLLAQPELIARLGPEHW